MSYSKIRWILAVTIVSLAGCAHVPRKESEFYLIRNGKPAASFVVTEAQMAETSSQGLYALDKSVAGFNADLAECAGVGLPALTTDDGRGPVIRFKVEKRTALDDDRYSIFFPDERSLLITGSAHGVRWALDHILEKHAGVLYLFPAARPTASDELDPRDGTHFPKITELRIPRTAMTSEPDWNLSRRGVYAPYWNVRMADFVLRVPCGHHMTRIVFPMKKYMNENQWPDDIFPVINGKRDLVYKRFGKTWNKYIEGWQPCLTDERVVDEAVKNINVYFDENPNAYGVSLAVNDRGGFCECENCRKLFGAGRGPNGHADYSDVYWRWVDKVAAGVAGKHPDKFIGALAYREVLKPPSFKLRDNIVPYLCYDICTCLDPKIQAKWTALVETWGTKAKYLGRWEYGWGEAFFQMPRVYFALQQKMLKTDHENGARAIWHTCAGLACGPKKYLYDKLLWNVDLDLDAELDAWYEACVGETAAPFLADYYRTWEGIWRGEVSKTAAFKNSKNAHYLSMGNPNLMYGVGSDDLPKLRGLMEKMMEAAERDSDARQKKRAKWLLADFDYTEACVKAIGGDVFPPSGAAETAEQALAYLKALPEIIENYGRERRVELHKKRFIHLSRPDRSPRRRDYIQAALAQVASLASEPKVFEAMKAAAANPKLPSEIRGLLNTLVKLERGEVLENLMLDGGFEKGNLDWTTWGERNGKPSPLSVSQKQAHGGKNALRYPLAPPHCSIISKHGRGISRRPVKPGKYYVSFMVYVNAENPDPESYVRFRVSRKTIGASHYNGHFDSSNYSVPVGEWTRLSLIADVKEEGNALNLKNIVFNNYALGDVAYVDDVVITPLGQ